MLLEQTLRLLAFTLGAALHVFLIVLLAGKKGRGLVEKLAIGALSAAGLWHAANAAAIFHRAAAGRESAALLDALDLVAAVGLAFAPALLFHLAIVWSRVTHWAAIAAYVAAPAVWWLLRGGDSRAYSVWLGACLALAAGLCLYAA